MARGVYFLANDKIYDLALVFLNSFRKFNPSIPLCLIPFDNEAGRIYELSEKYNFSVFNDSEALSRCDEISLNFHHYRVGQYRKIVAWQGVFDEFLYIDTDTVILQNIDYVFGLLPEFDFLCSYSNHKPIERWVWKESVYTSDILSNEQIEFAANTGFIVSKKGLLDLKMATIKIPEALALKPFMVAECLEQSFLNYLIISSGKKYSSLNALAKNGDSRIEALESWGKEKKYYRQGQLYKKENQKEFKVLFIHWAGLWQKTNLDYRIFSVLKYFGLRENIWQVNMLMPYKRIWKYFRDFIL